MAKATETIGCAPKGGKDEYGWEGWNTAPAEGRELKGGRGRGRECCLTRVRIWCAQEVEKLPDCYMRNGVDG